MNQLTLQGLHSGISHVYNAYQLTEFTEPERKATAEPFSTIFVLLESANPKEDLTSRDQIKKVYVLGSTLYQQELIDSLNNEDISVSHLLILQSNPNYSHAIISDVLILDFKPSQLWFVSRGEILKFSKA